MKTAIVSALVLIGAIVLTIMLGGCGRKDSQETTNPLDAVAAKASFYEAHITDEIYLQRCDKLTFKASLSAVFRQDIASLEAAPGEWHRDTTACYPVDSASEVSTEGILGVLHHIWTYRDLAMLNRLIAYGEAHNWVMGVGDTQNTVVLGLVPTIYDMRDRLSGSQSLTGPIDQVLQGYKGHILASWLWLRGRMVGALTDLELAAAKSLAGSASADPMYSAIVHRFTDGDQSQAIATLLDDKLFPADSIPTKTGLFGWGSCPTIVYYELVKGIMQGR
jgi:hypothetical protein